MPTINNNNNNKMTQKIAAEVVFHGKYIEYTACLGSHRQKTIIVCRKTTVTPYPKPDVSMPLALERKRLVFRGGSFCDDKTNGGVRRLLGLFWISQTNKKLWRKTSEMPPVIFTPLSLNPKECTKKDQVIDCHKLFG